MSLVAAACLEAGISVEDARSPHRHRHLTRSRYRVMAILRERHKWSLTRIGRELGARDHTTVMHGIKRDAELTAASAGTSESDVCAVGGVS